ncbi:MAG: septal ring lytic transglycosylase RlpA family protein [Haliscomenobacter sp.]|uniref:septal ring lytic transglycosylase RlpA family protein n=1 Tax=Haliscomenobacter sp. TaxID=2717303 RepID=UPI0029B208CF|nr:septal ring lytic transglycosylase RlpA family protein [Haliscomenobacter sp.]MDX2068597.1 septal ring lytic transglycosylase RlpA family protein [Haliscomenobacter sp.]
MNHLRKVSGLLAALFLNSIVILAQQADVGLSNYYSDALQGNPTAYGEVYDRTQYTASHRTYPKGTLLKVTRLDNNKAVIVRVNDRGPFSSDGAIISLSMAAASFIDLSLVGHAQVKVEQFGYADNNATAANYNTVNNQSSNSFAFDRIYNGAPQDAPQEYFTPKGTNGSNAYNNMQQQYGNTQQQYGNTPNNTQQPQYGPVPPSYDRRFQNRGGTYNAANEASNQVPSDYGYNGSGSSYNPAYNNANIPNSYSDNATSSNSNNPNFNWNNSPPNVSPGSIEGFPTLQAGSGFSVQVGSYTQLDNAIRQAQSLQKMGLSEIYLSQSPAANASGGRIYKIFAGRFDNREAATIYASQIKRQFLVNGFVLRM